MTYFVKGTFVRLLMVAFVRAIDLGMGVMKFYAPSLRSRRVTRIHKCVPAQVEHDKHQKSRGHKPADNSFTLPETEMTHRYQELNLDSACSGCQTEMFHRSECCSLEKSVEEKIYVTIELMK